MRLGTGPLLVSEILLYPAFTASEPFLVPQVGITGSALLAMSHERLDQLVEAYYLPATDVSALHSAVALLRPAQWSPAEAAAWLSRVLPNKVPWAAWILADGITGRDLLQRPLSALQKAV
jgi:hypothetical protein